MSFRRTWIFAGVVTLVACVGIAVMPHFLKTDVEDSFAWESERSSLGQSLGVDSSGLRVAYRYELDPSSLNPTYEPLQRDCSVVGKVSRPQSLSEMSEENYTESLLDSKGEVKQTNFIYGAGEEVPVKYVSFENEGKYETVFARFFKSENLLAVFTVSCSSIEERQMTAVEVADGVRFIKGSSKV